MTRPQDPRIDALLTTPGSHSIASLSREIPGSVACTPARCPRGADHGVDGAFVGVARWRPGDGGVRERGRVGSNGEQRDADETRSEHEADVCPPSVVGRLWPSAGVSKREPIFPFMDLYKRMSRTPRVVVAVLFLIGFIISHSHTPIPQFTTTLTVDSASLC